MPELAGDGPAHGVVVLAAGNSSRLGQSKQLLRYRGETLVHRAARLALTTAPHDAVIVLGAEADSIFPQVENLPIRRMDCADWSLGLAASLRAGVAALSTGCAGVLVVLCDQPGLDAVHLDALCTTWRNAPERGAASFYAERLGVPALLPRSWFTDFPLRGDRGAHALLAARQAQVTALPNPALAVDIDTPDDLAALA